MYMFYFYRDFEKISLFGNFYYDNKNLVGLCMGDELKDV